MRSGEALVLGGLIQDNTSSGKSGIPLLQDIPVVGALFGSNNRSTRRTELLVIITPKVVRNDIDAREVSGELRERMKSFSAIESLGGTPPPTATPAASPSFPLRLTANDNTMYNDMPSPARAPARTNPSRRLTTTALLGALLLGGCASLSSKPEDIVQRRAQDRWTALLEGRLDKAHTYLTPGFRQAVPFERYRARFGNAGSWQKAEVRTAQCQPEKCEVIVRVHTKVPGRGAPVLESDLRETWLLEDGQWWLFQKL